MPPPPLDTKETCESFDFCEMCEEGDEEVCGEEGMGKVNACFLSTKHTGEEGVKLLSATHCQHYDRQLGEFLKNLPKGVQN